MIKKIFDKTVFSHPIKVIAFFLLAIAFLAYFATKLEIDASAETLLLDDDKDLAYTRQINKTYDSQDFLLVTFTPKSKLLSNKSLNTIKNISKEFEKLEEITSVISILNVPLLQSPVMQIQELVDNVKTLENNKNIDKNLVKKEFLSSPLYEKNLVSSDFKTTSIVLNLKRDEIYFKLINKRNDLLKKQKNKTISQDELKTLEEIKIKFKEHRDLRREIEHKNIQSIRNIIKKYNNEGKLFLGGVSMIATDIVDFVKNDLLIYGTTLIILLILILYIIFRQIRIVTISVLICTLSVIATAGVLGLFSWEVTVISSNFISLQLIITISIVLHLIVRYRELQIKYKKSSQYKLLMNTLLSKLNPSFFAIITTIAGFSSLVFSNIQPVINLGWMMSVGIAISLFIAFFIFPSVLILLDNKMPNKSFEKKLHFMNYCINIVEHKPKFILFGTIFIIAFALTGASKLVVENSFISYFKKDTQIYKSMKIIDENLGGTTPLDIIVNFKTKEIKVEEKTEEFDDMLSSFEDEFEESENEAQYWFTDYKMEKIMEIHDYLESIKEIGKVQSLATMLKIGKILNKGENLDSFKLALLYNKLPSKYRSIILDPYLNIEKNQARFTVRIMDSNKNLRRNELIKRINLQLKTVINDDSITYKLTNLMILYNNMLQSLFDSQIKTLGFVLIILFGMFLVLFRSFIIATIALLSNLIPISIIFGIMGWLSIPLDIMTITIAAISIGIGVDDTIHYIHRFKEEYKKDHNYINAMRRSHESIGYAMTYTSLVVVVGFSILVLSNLIPTIYFGLLTVLVMITILLSALILLPRLLILFKPYSKL